MTKGRKKIPDGLKKLTGTLQKCRAQDENIEVISKLPPSPKWFSLKAKKIYRETGGVMIELGVLRQSDLQMLLSYVIEFSSYLKIKEEIEIEGCVINTRKGKVVNPKSKVANEHLKAAKDLAKEFGMTPASFARLNIRSEKKDELREILMRGDYED